MCQCEFDITYNDFNPTILFVSKERMSEQGIYHDHDFAEITYILSGKGKYLIEGKEYDVSAGDVVMCNPGTGHQHLLADPKNPTVEFFTGFSDFHFKNMPKNSIILPDGEYVLHTSSETKQEISKHCYEMLAENQMSL